MLRRTGLRTRESEALRAAASATAHPGARRALEAAADAALDDAAVARTLSDVS